MGSDAQPYVYVRSDKHGWVPGRQLSSDGKTATVAVQKYGSEEEMLVNAASTSGTKIEQQQVALKDYPSGVLPMQNVDDRGKLGNFPDMVNLPYLHEAGILYNLKLRHGKALPYTRTGDMVVAVNPYQWIDSLYTEKQRQHYAQKLVWESSEEDPRDHMAPHVYETSSLSYKGMAFEGQSQSILVSGESGAGKTETVKICMNHIASVQEGPSSGGSSGTSPIVQRILESNPLLEAFGNAKTRRNDNSSRFGKYLLLQFDHAGGVGRTVAKLVGSRGEVFLLEKNRVVTHESEERTYHIFYQLLAAPDDVKSGIWSGLKGSSNDSFKYVGHSETTKIEGMSDAEHFKKTIDVLKFIGLGEEEIKKFMRAICIVLQLGNVSFGPDNGDNDKSKISSAGELSTLAALMGIPENDLALCLTERTMKTKDETYKVPLNVVSAKDSADALAKEIYGKIFLWIVKAINVRTAAEEKPGSKFGIIGLLDIFGFESFGVNRFEQLCINYANEKLQQKFTEDIFKAVLAEYKFEGIPLGEVKYDDNTHVLDLIEGRTGLCALLNEECVRPKGSGSGFVNKALAANKNSPCLVPNKTDRLSFCVIHYAGPVMYEASNFVGANQDTLPTDLQDCATKCTNSIIADAFNYEKYHEGATSAKPKRAKSNIMAPTVWSKYKTQLSHLMTGLYTTTSRYIRCIKPNTVKKPLIMEHQTSTEQLRYAGIVAAVTISRSAFPNRLSNSVAYARYNGMWDRAAYPSTKSLNMTFVDKMRADCEATLTCVLKSKETKDKDGKTVKAFIVGKTRTYFRAGALEYLESQRITGLDAQALAIQKAARGWLVRKELGFGFSGKAKKEEAERLAREEAERMERLKAEEAEREAKFKEELKTYDKEIAALQRKMQDEDEKTEKAVKELEMEAQRTEEERDDLQKRIKENEDGILTTGREIDRLTKKVEGNTKLIEFLRKENKKFMKAFTKNEEQYNNLTKNNKKLTTALGLDNDIEGEYEYVMGVNERLLEDREALVKENAHMKDSVANEQSKYMAVAESRLEVQKTLAQILNTVQDKCDDNTLLQDVYAIAHECEAEAKAIMDALESGL